MEYRFPEGDWAASALDAALVPLGLMTTGSAQSVHVTYMDTFDGRLFDRGKVFQVEHCGGRRSKWVLRDFREHDFEFSAAAGSVSEPRYLQDIDDEGLHRELSALIDIRALLPCAEVRRKRHDLRFDNDADTLPVDVHLDVYQWIGRTKATPASFSRLVIETPDPAGKKSIRRAVEDWAEQRALQRAEQDVWLDILSSVGKPAGPGCMVEPPDLAPEMRADLAVKRILTAQLAIIRAQEQGVLANLDTEFLHDFRVAVRRSRSLLGQLKGIFPERTIAIYRRELSWLGAITSPGRDFDVYLLEFPQLEDALPEFMRGDLTPLRSLLEYHAADARKQLEHGLRSSRYHRFIERWEAFLRKPVPKQPSAPLALQPFQRVAGRRIWKLYRRVVKDGRLLGDQVPGTAIHELRKRCKKIRYLTEFIAPLQGHVFMRGPIKDLKALQTHLGAFQDAEVQIAHLREWSAELADAPAATLLAVGALIGYFDQRQMRRRRALAAVVEEFARKENRERFRRLLSDPE